MSDLIYVDVDDVLADTTEALVGLVHQLFDRRVTYDDCQSFDLGESFGLSEEERDRLLDAAHSDHVIEAMSVVPGAARTLEDWRSQSLAVHVVTGRPPQTLDATRRWLEREGLHHASLESVDKYGRQGGIDDAVPLADLSDRRYRVAVEDSLSMATFLAEVTRTPVLLMDRPWNRRLDDVPRRVRALLRRVYSWEEIRSLVEGSAGG